MNSERRVGFVISALLHGLSLGVLVRPVILQPKAPETTATVEVLQVDVADLAGVTDQTFDFDVEKIISRGGSLFPFTRGDVLQQQIPTRLQKENDVLSTSAFAVVSSINRPPLELTRDQLQELLDKSWSRRRRWDAFKPIAEIASDHDPEVGDLPLLLRGYVEQNSLQPFTASWYPEGKLWALLSIAADHADFVEYISRFIAQHPSSRSSTELLFLLDNVVQANLEALITLVRTDPLTDLHWTQAANPRAMEALSALHLYHQTALGRRGFWRVDALKMTYDTVRVKVLLHLIRNTPRGYRSNDALFLLGEIYWRQGKFGDAAGSWQKMVPHPTDTHFAASLEIRQALTHGTADRDRITAALDRNKDRWIDASFVRLKRFGYRFNTF
jgi:hypothetical protein